MKSIPVQMTNFWESKADWLYVDQANHLYMDIMALNKDSLWVLISIYWLIGIIVREEIIMVNQVKRLICAEVVWQLFHTSL